MAHSRERGTTDTDYYTSEKKQKRNMAITGWVVGIAIAALTVIMGVSVFTDGGIAYMNSQNPGLSIEEDTVRAVDPDIDAREDL